ncbi:unnamed protein product, partial [Brenthis ino]
MADSHFGISAISKRAQTILNMVKEKPATLLPNQNLKTKNNSKPKPGSTDHVMNSIYMRPYSMTASIFDTFCETQTTYNSHHLLSLDTSKLKQALSNETRVHQTITKDVAKTPVKVDLTCNESMPLEDSPLEVEFQSNTKEMYENSPHDFDSDDSVLDKDYFPSDSPERPEVSERKKKEVQAANKIVN